MLRVAALLVVSLFGFRATAQESNPQQIFQEAAQAQQRGDNELAARKYQEVIQLNPNVVAAHANLGVVLVSLGRYDEAITQYNVALAEAPGNPELRLNLGLAYYKKGDFAGAAAQFASLHKENPTDLKVATLLGNCQVQLGLVEQSLALLEPLEKPNPDNLDLEWSLGMALLRAGQTQEALQRIQKVADQGQNAEAYQLAANLSIGLTYFDQARRDAEAVLRLNPKATKAHVVLGMADDYSGNEKEAEVEYEKALQIDPQDLQALLRLANDFITERKLDAARQQLDRVLALDANSLVARYELARVERAEGNLSAAVKDYETVAQQSPEWLQPHVELAALYYQVKRPEDGAREKEIVDNLRSKEQARRGQNRIISPQVPPQ
ncbi:MAG TPA: tetratricopeptide repeat protein [Candidatus Acidoferrum sp.]|nr:tetratricopeptide repeat protein [Candidatus Acidoferrum sp.]